MRKEIICLMLVFGLILSVGFISAQVESSSAVSAEQVDVSVPTVCCEKTKSGLYCQDVPEADCSEDEDSRMIPTACESTSFCAGGYCFDSVEGTCLDNTAEVVCNDNGGTWAAEKPAQCELGCCVLGDQASFVTLVRCKRLSSMLGLQTDFDSGIRVEVQCILSALGEEKGACVYEEELEKTCKFTTRSQCSTEAIGGTSSSSSESTGSDFSGDTGLTAAEETTEEITIDEETEETTEEEVVDETADATITGEVVGEGGLVAIGYVEFFAGKLCSDEELGTNCGPTKDTICVAGKEEVYFVDTCGNAANIYDANKVNDDLYWSEVFDKSESCSADGSNKNSQTCGNCNYLLGSYCRAGGSSFSPTYGTNYCAGLGCVDEEGVTRMHGESWCVYDTKESGLLNLLGLGGGAGAVGSKYYREVCSNGKVLVEPCAEFRQEECIENVLETSEGPYSQSACRVNRWQDCTSQTKVKDCENEDQRDCRWLDGIEYILMGTAMNGTSVEGNSFAGLQQSIKDSGGLSNMPKGACVPEIPPGLNFWQEGDSATVCAQANAVCPVKYEKGLLDDEWECVEHCECLSDGLEAKRAQVCAAMGDCGIKTNWLGVKGSGEGYTITQEDLDDDDDDGGIF